jgi:hypothetical protein
VVTSLIGTFRTCPVRPTMSGWRKADLVIAHAEVSEWQHRKSLVTKRSAHLLLA